MSLYDGIKDVAKIVQQADNVDLYKQLLDLSAQALDLQAENAELKSKNRELKEELNSKARIQRHRKLYLTIEGDKMGLQYCSACYDSEGKLIQLLLYDNGVAECPKCRITLRTWRS